MWFARLGYRDGGFSSWEYWSVGTEAVSPGQEKIEFATKGLLLGCREDAQGRGGKVRAGGI